MKIISIRRKSNGEGKVLITNFMWLSLLQVGNYILPLMTLPYLARTLGVDGFGKIAFASAVIMWCQAITDWGFNYTATRDIARNREDISIVSQIFSNVFWSRILLMLISLMVLVILITLIPYFRDNRLILGITFLLIPGHILCPEWLFQGLERMKYITIINVVAKVVFTVLVFILIKKKEDYILQPLLISIGYIVAGGFSAYVILCKWHIKLYKPCISKIIVSIKSSMDVFINGFFPNLYNSFSVVLLGFCGGSVANGIYDAGSKLINIIIQFIQVLSRSFFPFLSRKIEYHSKYTLLNISIILILTLVILIFSKNIIDIFFSTKFQEAIIVTRILALSLPFLALSNIYGANYLIIVGHTRILRNISIVSSLIGFFLAFPLIYFYSFTGTAITVMLARSIIGISTAMYGIKIKKSICGQ